VGDILYRAPLFPLVTTKRDAVDADAGPFYLGRGMYNK